MTGSLFGSDSGAVISPCGMYRYSLTRKWDEEGPTLCFVMLNPSTADADKDDPTLRRCRGFAAQGYGSLEVVNLFALRATDPKMLYKAADPIGPENDRYIDAAVAGAKTVIVAWGAHGGFMKRGETVLARIPRAHCLEVTAGGHPKHPLYIAGSKIPVLYAGCT